MNNDEMEQLAVAIQEARSPRPALEAGVIRALEWQLVLHSDRTLWASPIGPGIWGDKPPRLMSSLDNARALMPRGWGMTLHDPNPGVLRAVATMQGALNRELVPIHENYVVGTGWFAPCAILSAVLRAHIVIRSARMAP